MYKVLRVWGVRIGFRVEGVGFYYIVYKVKGSGE